ncbi:aminoglycoside phosphotransferase family protein [Brachybacterium tyrofermentans]
MHDDELDLPHDVAVRLLVALLPGVAPSDVHRVESTATTSHIVRIGSDLTARFPIVRTDPDDARTAIEVEHRAMAEFAAASPLPAPEPVAIGDPDSEYPMPWSVQTWVPGDVADPDSVASSDAAAGDLAELLAALHATPTRGRRFTEIGQGGELAAHDDWVQQCLERTHQLLEQTETPGHAGHISAADLDELAARWSRWRSLGRSGPDVMCHRDLTPMNMLCADGRLTGVLDTGGFCPADPSVDLVPAWHLLDAPRRDLLREHLGSSDLEWERGAAWAFEQAIGLVWYYDTSNPPMAALGRSTVRRLVEDPIGSARLPGWTTGMASSSATTTTPPLGGPHARRPRRTARRGS